MMTSSVEKFDAARADEYAIQSRIALAGYDACHELAACLLAARLVNERNQHVLIVGAGGTGQEVLTAGKLRPGWRFTAVDPSPPMLALAQAAVEHGGLSASVTWHAGSVEDLPSDQLFDAATLIGVLHHLPGHDAKRAILRSISARLRPEAPLILACNRGSYVGRPLFLDAWANRWRVAGAVEEEVQAKLAKIVQGADPPSGDAEVADLLSDAGFNDPQLFFSSLFWGGWIATR